MKILVTGANGYLGQGVVKALLDNGHSVVAADFKTNYVDKPKPKEETPQSENLETDQSLATVNEDNQSGNENGT